MHFSRTSASRATRFPRYVLLVLCCFLITPPSAAGTVLAAASDKATPGRENTIDSYTITQRGDGFRVNITYPQVGNPVADAELSIWAREQAAMFTQSVQMIPMLPPVPYELSISYKTLKASAQVISVVFFISTSMGGTNPEPGQATFIYNMHDGRRLSYNDLFMQYEEIVWALSGICRTSLTEQLGDKAIKTMLEAGTAPDMANFDLFALVPNGIRVFFPPYQVAPYSEGYLNVTIPLTELTQFKPHKAFWDNP